MSSREEDAESLEHVTWKRLVGEAIRRLRHEQGFTQAYLASQARLSANYIARLERGELGPSLFVAHRICLALGVVLDSLVRVEANDSPEPEPIEP